MKFFMNRGVIKKETTWSLNYRNFFFFFFLGNLKEETCVHQNVF